MKTLIEANKNLNKATAVITTAKLNRATAVNDTMDAIFDIYNDKKELFANRRTAMRLIIQELLNVKTIDPYTKRAIKVARIVLVEGYKMKKELLSLAQLEALSCFDKTVVNKLMKTEDDEDYVEACKELIKTAYVEATAKTFSKATAKTVKGL